MPLFDRLRQKVNQIQGKIDPHSLRFRLTIGVATVAAAGMGGVALWTSWKMQDLLIVTHKQNVQYIVSRFPEDVERYSEMKSARFGVQPAIDRLGVENVFLWVKDDKGRVVAQSMALEGRSDNTRTLLTQVSGNWIVPRIDRLNGRYFMVCSVPLQVKGMDLGQLYVAQDITADRKMFAGTIRSLGIASLLAIALMTVAIAVYIRRSLRSLRQFSQFAETISAENFGQIEISLDRAPSEIRELAQTCKIVLDRLSESCQQQRQFVGNVSHELRTPLTLVSGYLQSTLRRGNNLTEPQREALSIAASEADRTVRLLQDLLDLARADRGYLPFHLEPVELNELITEVAHMTRQYTSREIVYQDNGNLIKVKADRDRLQQVLINLIDNAVKYSQPEQPVTLSLEQNCREAIIKICDRGVGIPLQHQSRIFERFYRCDEDRCRATGGSGLGLAIVKTLVEGMGGRVKVRSTLGKGSTFSVLLPLDPSGKNADLGKGGKIS
ncbi:MAG: HAMP domain-containing sensor histidine kinase [Geitlerinemataceae cyanobacterium]